ncbi:MAG: metallophosphoesterase [Candidatus Scalindua sp.]|nr:metallophosphoesterase [Candidatus Scalindua sp.]
MKFAIFSDIHSNLEALAAVFLDILNTNEKIDTFLIPGDIVGYGANPNEWCTIINFLKNGKASYMIYDTVLKKICLKRSAYNTEATKAKILKAKLPTDLANRLVKGN